MARGWSQSYTASSAGAAVSKTYAAQGGVAWEVGDLDVGYDAAPSGGYVSIESPVGTEIYRLPITGAGPAPLPKRNGWTGAVGAALKVILGAPGGTIVGYLNVRLVE